LAFGDSRRRLHIGHGRRRIIEIRHYIEIGRCACELRFEHVGLECGCLAFAIATISPSAAPSAPSTPSLSLAIRFCGDLGTRGTKGIRCRQLDEIAAGIVLACCDMGRLLRREWSSGGLALESAVIAALAAAPSPSAPAPLAALTLFLALSLTLIFIVMLALLS
jgi:hypothetical protein